MMFRIFIILAIMASFFSTTLSAKTYNLATGNDYAPYTGEDLPNRGMATEIVERVFEEMGDETNIVFRPWTRAYIETTNLKFDGLFPYVESVERLKACLFSKPIVTISTKFFVKSNSNLQKINPETMQELKACSPIGYSITGYRDYKLDFHRNPDIAGCFRMLKSGRVDVVPITTTAGWASIKKTFGSKKGFRTLDKILSKSTLSFLVSKKHPEAQKLIQRFNNAFQKLQNNGTIKEIVERHLNL